MRNEASRRKLMELLDGVPTQRLRVIVGDYTTKVRLRAPPRILAAAC